MNLYVHSSLRPRKRAFGAIAFAIVTAAMISAVTVDKAAAGRMSGGVRAAPATMAAKASPSKFNHVANEVRPSQKPSVVKEPCRGRRCGNPWHDHTH